MKLPPSSLHFRVGLADNPIGRVFSGSISIQAKEADACKMRQLGWYQLVMILQGEGMYRDRDGRAFPMRRGDLIITSPGMLHALDPSPDSAWSKLIIKFNGSLFDSLHQSGLLKCQVRARALTPIDTWYQRFCNLMQLKPGESTQPMCYLSRFLGVLGAIPFEKTEVAAENRPAWLADALAWIEAADQTNPLDVQQVARRCHLGYASFRKYFSHFIGYGPSEYHKNLRIKTASEMIAYGSDSFKQIALQLGYYDNVHFSKHFKEKTGLSPRQFRAELVKRKIQVVDSGRVQKLALQEWFKAEEEKRRLEERTAAERQRHWRLVFQEDFSNQKNLTRWTIQGDWECKNSELCIRGKEGLVATLNTPIPGDVRLVFDCHLESAFLSDVSCFLCASHQPESVAAYATGYLFQYGAIQNRRTLLTFDDKVLWNQPSSPLVRGKTYHVDAQKIGNRLILNVDDNTILDVREQNSLSGAEHAFVGLHSWGTEAYFSNVKVYTRDSAVHADLLECAEDFLSRGDYSTAKGLFQEVVNSSQNLQRTEQAKHGLSKALKRIGLTAEFSSIKKRLLKIWPKAVIQLDSRGILVHINASGIDDLSPLQGLPLSEISCDNNRITNLNPLKGMTGLKKLSCFKNQIASLEPLQGMNLEFLECSDNQISSLDPLRGMELKHLACAKNQLSNIEPLRGMKLDILACACNKIESLAPLRNMGLLRLSCPNNRVKSLEPLRGVSLDFINCSYNQIHDLEPLRGMGLSELRCNGNRITSLAPLQGMLLNSLRCASNQIESLDPLQEMTLSILSCHDNPIPSIRPLLKHLPRGLYVSLENLAVSEQRELRAHVETPGFAELLRSAEILFHVKQKNYDKIRSMAQPFGNHRYLLVPKECTCLEAKAICELLGGHLAVIRSRKENDFLRAHVREGSYCWIGLYFNNNTLTWITGEPCHFRPVDSKKFPPGYSFVLSSSGIWGEHAPGLEGDGFCVEWDA